MEKIWKIPTEKEAIEWKALEMGGASECMTWLYENGYLNMDMVIKEFEVQYNDDMTAFYLLEEKYKNSRKN